MPLKVIKTKRSKLFVDARLRSIKVSPTSSKIAITRASIKRDLPPQISAESAADIPVLRESDSVLQEMPLSELFTNENFSEITFGGSASSSNFRTSRWDFDWAQTRIHDWLRTLRFDNFEQTIEFHSVLNRMEVF